MDAIGVDTSLSVAHSLSSARGFTINYAGLWTISSTIRISSNWATVNDQVVFLASLPIKDLTISLSNNPGSSYFGFHSARLFLDLGKVENTPSRERWRPSARCSIYEYQ
jgi:hypothetical protein